MNWTLIQMERHLNEDQVKPNQGGAGNTAEIKKNKTKEYKHEKKGK